MMLDNELHHNHNNDNNSHHMNTHQRSGLANLLPHLCSTMPVTPKEGIIVQASAYVFWPTLVEAGGGRRIALFLCCRPGEC